jgi:hypothetical protein
VLRSCTYNAGGALTTTTGHIIHCCTMDVVAEVEGITSTELNALLWGRPFAEVMSSGEGKR